MTGGFRFGWIRVDGSSGRWIVAASLCAVVGAAWAADAVNLLALFENKALLYINGERRMLAVGETSPEGVRLISADSEQAVVHRDGISETLVLGTVATFPGSASVPEAPSWEGPESVSLWADPNGFFFASGSINGYPIRFLVDTGATTIAINSRLAQQIGIDLGGGRRGLATTASGVTPMVAVTLDSVTVGEIFLGQLDMVRQGNRMDLKRRF